MKYIEQVTFEVEEKIINKEVLYNTKVELLEITNIWDNHGHYVPWENNEGKKTQTFRNKNIKIERITKEMFGHKYQFDILYIDNKKYSAIDLYKVKGNNLQLKITACVGQG